jgi:hypothetical protein
MDMLAAALSYIARGYAPIPIPHREKGPRIDAWQALRVNTETAPAYFNGTAQNIGVILGSASGGLTDVDIDCPEAIAAAGYILPRTAVFGHASKPASHWIYRTNLCETQDRAAIKLMGSDKTGLLEIRMGAGERAAQTVFPPSTHVSGEPIEWAGRGANEIADADGEELVQCARRLAAASELARNYPKIGGRHDAAFVLGGFLARCGFSPSWAATFVEAVGTASLQPGDKRRDMARTARDGAAAGRLAGFPLLAETFGEGPAKKAADWLGYKGERERPSEEHGPRLIPPFSGEDDGKDREPPTIKATPLVWVDPTKIPRRRWLYGRHYVRKFVSETVAPGAYGKSTLAITEALAIATGRTLLDVTPDERANVWIWNGEDPMEELQRRIIAAALYYEIDPTEIEGRLFVDTGRKTKIIIAEQTKTGAIVARPIVDAVTTTIKTNEIGLMIVDPFVASHRVVENDNPAIELVAAAWAEIADVTGCAIELVHHARKTGGAEITVDDGRGGSALLAKVRSARTLNGMSEDEAARAGVENRRAYFRIQNGKANLSPSVDASEWYRLESFDLRNSGDGQPSDSVGVATRWKWPDAFDDVTVSDLRRVQDAIDAGRWRESSQAKDWAGHAVAKVLNLDPTVKAHKAKIGALLKTWIANGVLVVIEGKDSRHETRSFIEVGTTAND